MASYNCTQIHEITTSGFSLIFGGTGSRLRYSFPNFLRVRRYQNNEGFKLQIYESSKEGDTLIRSQMTSAKIPPRERFNDSVEGRCSPPTTSLFPQPISFHYQVGGDIENLKWAFDDTSASLLASSQAESLAHRYWPNSRTTNPPKGNGSWQEAAPESNQT